MLMRAGWGQIVVGHDVFSKHRLINYGGHGYSHILQNVGACARLRLYHRRGSDSGPLQCRGSVWPACPTRRSRTF
jgi:hypothetical protein